MSKSRTKNAALNIFFSLLLQLVTCVRGLILPGIIIPAYGSDVNGLVSSISQFLTYISLLEAGVGSIFRASLYKPLANGDMDKVSGIINEQKRFYRKIGMIFVLYVVVLCFIYPLIAKTDASKPYVISLLLILSVSTFTEYFFSLPYTSLLSADQLVRITYIVSIIYTLVNILVSLVCVSLKADIRMIYLSMSIVGLLRPLFYTLYVRKHYRLNKDAKPDKVAMAQRTNGIVHHFAYYIHTNTDSAILTIFLGTAMVSVYNVYGAIIFGMEKIINSVSSGASAGIGNLVAIGDQKSINKTVDVFELVQGGIATVVFTITAILLIPFIRLYTANMTDVNYLHPAFGYTLILAEVIYCFRCIYSTISTSANKFKETQLGAVLECVVNLVSSLALVLIAKMGLLGVAIGTVLGMFVRYIFEVVFLSKNVICRPVWKAMKMIVASASICALSVLICHIAINYSAIETYGAWVCYAVATSFITISIATVIYFALYHETALNILHRVFRRA
jgi:Na+-driven multidrug efflux pump